MGAGGDFKATPASASATGRSRYPPWSRGTKLGGISMKLTIGSAPDSWGIWFPNDPRQTQRFLDEIKEAGYHHTDLGPCGYLPTDLELLGGELGKHGLKVTGSFVLGRRDRSDGGAGARPPLPLLWPPHDRHREPSRPGANRASNQDRHLMSAGDASLIHADERVPRGSSTGYLSPRPHRRRHCSEPRTHPKEPTSSAFERCQSSIRR